MSRGCLPRHRSRVFGDEARRRRRRRSTTDQLSQPEGQTAIGMSTLSIGRSGEIRTPDPLLPKQVRYQAALRSARPSLIHRDQWKSPERPQGSHCKARRLYSGHFGGGQPLFARNLGCTSPHLSRGLLRFDSITMVRRPRVLWLRWGLGTALSHRLDRASERKTGSHFSGSTLEPFRL